MSDSPIHPGAVAWTGENPGIYLKDRQDGPWTGLMTFYRITWSEHGRGHGVLLLDEPNVEKSPPDVANFCICDNEPLAKYLVDEFFSNFASFKVSPGLKAIQYLPLTEVYREGDTRNSYTEVVKSAEYEIRQHLERAWYTLCCRHAAGDGTHQEARDVQPVPRRRRRTGHGERTPAQGACRGARLCRYEEVDRVPRVFGNLDGCAIGEPPLSRRAGWRSWCCLSPGARTSPTPDASHKAELPPVWQAMPRWVRLDN